MVSIILKDAASVSVQLMLSTRKGSATMGQVSPFCPAGMLELLRLDREPGLVSQLPPRQGTYAALPPVPSHFSCVQLGATPWTVADQAPLSVGFSRQEGWSGLPCPPPGIFLTQGLNPRLLCLHLGSPPPSPHKNADCSGHAPPRPQAHDT